MKLRVVTGLVIGIVSLLVVLVLPVELSSLIFAALCLGALAEFIAIVRHVVPSAPLRSLYAWTVLFSLLGFYYLHHADSQLSAMALLCLLTGLMVGVSACVLFTRTEMKDAVGALGVLSFAIPYFVLPQLSIFWLMQLDRWLVFLVITVVAMSDTLAYFVGRAWGKHKMAPIVSPKKSWEGSIAGLLAGVLTAAAWSHYRLGGVDSVYLLVGAGTAVAGQLGDLVESLIKRGAGVKDSSGLLPGHGGLYDRIDALLFAAPVFVGLLWFLDLVPGAR